MIQCSYDTKSFQMAEQVSKCSICGLEFKNSNNKKMHCRKPCGEEVRLWCSYPSTFSRPAKPLQVLPKLWKRSLKGEVLTKKMCIFTCYLITRELEVGGDGSYYSSGF